MILELRELVYVPSTRSARNPLHGATAGRDDNDAPASPHEAHSPTAPILPRWCAAVPVRQAGLALQERNFCATWLSAPVGTAMAWLAAREGGVQARCGAGEDGEGTARSTSAKADPLSE